MALLTQRPSRTGSPGVTTGFVGPALIAVACVVASNGCSPATNNGKDEVGSVPETYIHGEAHSRLVFEVDSVEGVAPRADATGYVVEELSAVVDKPDGIEFVTDGTIESRGADHVWTFDELETLAGEQFDMEVEDEVVKIHVMYVDGSYENENTLGVAWGNRHLTMFADVVDDSCDRPLVRDRLCRFAESSVLLHEVGHVIGLVDNGIPMVEDHEDSEHDAHDESDECVMYWAYEGTQIIDVLAARLGDSSPALTFDDACEADIAAIRDR